MRFQLENQLEQFIFQDSQLVSWKSGDNIQLEIAAPVAKATNPRNESMEERYIETIQLHLLDARVESIVKEGYKYYDANDVLVEQVPDQPVAPLEYDSIIKKCVDGQAYLFQLEPQQVENGFSYRMFLDLEETTYMITVSFSKSIAEWERFQNKFMQ